MDVKQLAKAYDAYIRAPKYTENGDAELFCVCRKPDTGELMVGCDGCDDWFHFKCMKLELQWKSLVKSYYCPFCHTLKDLGTTLWKRKCRLNECYEPIMEQSAFCSEDHGALFWNRVVARFGKDGTEYDEGEKMSVEELVGLMQLLESKTQLDKLGDELPAPPLPSGESVKDSITIRNYEAKIVQCNGELLTIKTQVESLESKKVYLNKVRALVIKVNEIVNDTNNSDPSLNENETQPAPTKKKAKKKGGNKKPNIEICGYDSNLSRKWDEYAKTEDIQSFINLILSEEDRKLIKEDYLVNYRTEGIVKTKYLQNICMNDKRKCIHSTWFTIEKDDVDIKLDILNNKMEEINSNIEELNKLITIEKFIT